MCIDTRTLFGMGEDFTAVELENAEKQWMPINTCDTVLLHTSRNYNSEKPSNSPKVTKTIRRLWLQPRPC